IDDCGIDILLTRTPAGTAAADFRARYVESRVVRYRRIKRYSKRLRQIVERNVPVYATVSKPLCRQRRYAMRALHGGRRECFYRGELPNVYEYDAKSAYPSSCVSIGLLPLGCDIRRLPGKPSDLEVWLTAVGGWGKIHFRFPPGTRYPCLPVDTPKGIIYPLSGTSWCTNYEARVASEMGAEIRIEDGYYYNTGVPWMARYQERLLALRRSTTDPILSAIYKRLANSIVGKLSQHRGGYDIGDLLRASRESGIPVEIIQQVANLPRQLGVRKSYQMGSLFMPEWYVLIVGWYRANISSLIPKVEAVQVATDAVFTERYMGDKFVHNGITYELVSSGPYVGYRSGLYRVADNVRHHGCSSDAGKMVLDKFLAGVPWVEYKANHITTLKESVRHGGRMGEMVIIPRRVCLYFDGKRKLESDTGWSTPLNTAAEFMELKIRIEKEELEDVSVPCVLSGEKGRSQND
ncbi:MAG: hypothetical protein ABIN58_06320, partial [candidate division WOR-3 bacterium]